jgi:hypothetical protein
MKNSILNFLKNWHELFTLPLAILIWYISPSLLRLIDPTAGVYDAGIFQNILFAVIAVMVFHFFAWIMLKMTFPGVYNYLDTLLEQNLKSFPSNPNHPHQNKPLDLWQRSKLVLFLFSLYFLAFILAFRVI